MRVLESQYFILGEEVAEFEKEIAPLTGCRFAIGCASGSDALLLALMALEVRPGDEVITTPFTFFATAGSISRLQVRPVFVDIDPVTYNMDPGQVESAITPKTRAIMPVHLFGLCADMDPILEAADRHHLPVIEDAAQAIGAQYHGKRAGSLGLFGCFSFFPSKNLGGAGDGGMITTNDAGLADTLRMLRVHGSRQRYQHEKIGINSRLDALQAAVLRVKIRHLDDWTAGRQTNAARYRELFRAHGLETVVTAPTAPDGYTHVYNQFTIRTTRRDALREHLKKRGLPTEIYYPVPLHLQTAFAYLGYRRGDFPQAELSAEQVLSLPIYPELTADRQRKLVTEIEQFFAEAK